MPTARRRPVPDDLFGGRLKDCFLLDLEVVAVSDSRPPTRTITLASPDLVDFAWTPGQDVMFDVPGAEQGPRRRYTIRRADAASGTLDIDVVLHGTGPFAGWAARATVGDRLSGIGPRGVVTIREDASHHLFVADESATPFALAMIEALPAGVTATAILTSDEPIPTPAVPSSAADVGITSVTTGELTEQLAAVPLPDGVVAYVNGERLLVRQASQQLAARGLDPDAIVTKAYWRRDQPNAAHGEPTKD